VFALDPRALDEAAGRIDAVAASLACLDVTGPFGLVGDALPGSATRDACLWASTDLEAAVDGWGEHLLDLCRTARQVARDAASTDHAVGESFRTVSP
jgi:hypothetical protein